MVAFVSDYWPALGEGDGIAAKSGGQVDDWNASRKLTRMITSRGEAGGLLEGFSFEDHFAREVAEFFRCSFTEIELHERPAGSFVAVFGGELLGREGRGVGEGVEVEQVVLQHTIVLLGISETTQS